MDEKRIGLPDGENFDVEFVSKGGQAPRVQPTTPPPAGRIRAQPVHPPHTPPTPFPTPGPQIPVRQQEPMTSVPTQTPAEEPPENILSFPAAWKANPPKLAATAVPVQAHGEGGLGATAGAVVASPTGTARDGLIEGLPTGTRVDIEGVDVNQLAEAHVEHVHAQVGHTELPHGQLIEIGDDGLQINGHRLPEEGLTGPIVVEHIDHDDARLKVTVSYLADRESSSVQQDLEKQFLIEDVPHHEALGGCTCQLAGQTARVVELINKTRRIMRRFVLQRDRDDTGVTGTGVVAEGVQLSDGRVVIRWLGAHSSIVFWDDIGSVLRVHGHKGATRLRWLDADS
jgi:hypothetical protein